MERKVILLIGLLATVLTAAGCEPQVDLQVHVDRCITKNMMVSFELTDGNGKPMPRAGQADFAIYIDPEHKIFESPLYNLRQTALFGPGSISAAAGFGISAAQFIGWSRISLDECGILDRSSFNL